MLWTGVLIVARKKDGVDKSDLVTGHKRSSYTTQGIGEHVALDIMYFLFT